LPLECNNSVATPFTDHKLQGFSMKNTVALVAILAALTALTACKPADAPAPAPAPASAPAAAPAPAPAATPAAAPAAAPAPTASADIPKECQDYLDKMTACAGKQSGAAADAMKSSMDQVKATWAGMSADKASLAASCKAASDAFAAQATAMNC
jgi:hypothetical protein